MGDEAGAATGLEACPVSCGTCPDEAPSVAEPTLEPTTSEPETDAPTSPTACADDPDWRFKTNPQDCAWAAGNTWRCSRNMGDEAGAATGLEACPVSCGTCPDEAPSVAEPTLEPTTSE